MTLGKMLAGAPDSRYIGLELEECEDVGQALGENVRQNMFDFVVIPITNPRYAIRSLHTQSGAIFSWLSFMFLVLSLFTCW